MVRKRENALVQLKLIQSDRSCAEDNETQMEEEKEKEEAEQLVIVDVDEQSMQRDMTDPPSWVSAVCEPHPSQGNCLVRPPLI